MKVEIEERNKIWRLYERYGYRAEENCEDYMIFALENVMYPAVDILVFNEQSKECEQKRSEYSASGFGVRRTVYDGLESIENYLFKGFFRVDAVNKQLEANYERYAAHQMKVYHKDKSDYRYIPIPYTVETNFMSEPGTEGTNLVDAIYSNLQSERPVLIIIEAAAGYGKTSTAYELIHRYTQEQKNVRPFFMELFKDRTASNFHYLLLSQIEQQFDILLKNDIVLHNIREGRIPLIIDGFDELLSADLDNGGINADFKEVETMLSTISDLLTDHSKVVLTTRKTAIFSGQSFIDWYCDRISSSFSFDIIRYQLSAPTFRDWLDASRRKTFSNHHIGSSIANPVLMGYLRYIDDGEFNSILQNPSLLTDKFFTFMLKREIERQELPFTVQEQFRILSRLAALFGGFQITSDSRASVKQSLLELNRDLIEQKAVVKEPDSIANTLTNHALLDRKGTENIGFLNDFIFGTLFMHAVINGDADMTDYLAETSYPFLEKAILAAAVSDESRKEMFYEQLQAYCTLKGSLRFWAGLKLMNRSIGLFSDESFDAGSLYNPVENCHIGENDTDGFSSCSFSNIAFHHCHFNFNRIECCTFINCKFEDCSKNGTTQGCEFYNCIERCDAPFVDAAPVELQEENNYGADHWRHEILATFTKVDGRTRRMRMISKLREEFGNRDASLNFKKLFASLTADGYIFCNGDKAFITDEGMRLLNLTSNADGRV